MKASLLVGGLLSTGFSNVAALQIPVQRRAAPVTKTGVSAHALRNGNNLLYMANVTLGGVGFQVQTDTGSSDLWVISQKPISNINTTDIVTNITYGLGATVGNVSYAPLEFGSYSVPSQAFVFNGSVDQPTLDGYASVGAEGLVGLGFDTALSSEVLFSTANVTHNAKGRTVLGNIFEQNPSLPNSLSILLMRTDDLESTADGMFAIGEEVPGYENVTQTPKLERFNLAGQRSLWSVLLDDFSVNGKSLGLQSALNDTSIPKGKLVTVLDSGTSSAQVSVEAAKQIYGGLPGAIYNEPDNQWMVPCNAAVNVTLTFGGQKFSVHPLDLTVITDTLLPDGKNVSVCIGNWSPSPAGDVMDFILGDAFLRNSYVSFNYGNISLIDEDISNPFVHMLPLTNANAAWSDFFRSRAETMKQHAPEATLDEIHQLLNMTSSTSSSSGSSAGPSTSSSSSPSRSPSPSISTSSSSFPSPLVSSTDKELATDKISSAISDSGSGSSPDAGPLLQRLDKYGPVVVGLLAGNILVGIGLCIIGISFCVQRRRRTLNPSYAPVREIVTPNFDQANSYVTKYHD